MGRHRRPGAQLLGWARVLYLDLHRPVTDRRFPGSV